jgi:hypothetical protein
MQIMIPTDLSTVPGLAESVEALQRVWHEQSFFYDVGGRDLVMAAATVLAVSRPYIVAEAMADTSDYLNELGLCELADLLDNVSAGLRKELHGG